MVSLVNGTINPRGGEGGDRRIKGFEVWFSTPYGLYQFLDRAIQKCVESDLEPELCIKPVVVAVGENDICEVI